MAGYSTVTTKIFLASLNPSVNITTIQITMPSAYYITEKFISIKLCRILTIPVSPPQVSPFGIMTAVVENAPVMQAATRKITSTTVFVIFLLSILLKNLSSVYYCIADVSKNICRSYGDFAICRALGRDFKVHLGT